MAIDPHVRRHRAKFGLFIVAFCLACVESGNSQSNTPFTLDRALNQRIPVGSISGTFVEALGQIAQSFNISMGISVVNTARTQEKRTVSYKNATLLEIITAVAKTEPNYEVVVSNGVVHVATKDVPTGQNFLNLRVLDFAAKGNANFVKGTLWMQLNQRISPDPKRGYGGSMLRSPAEPILNFTFSDTTVGEILDAIAVASDYKVWLVTFEDNLNLTPSGFRRAEALSPGDRIPDEAQPAWDILRLDYWPLKVVPYVPSSN